METKNININSETVILSEALAPSETTALSESATNAVNTIKVANKKVKKPSGAITFLDNFCVSMGVNKDEMRASTNRAVANTTKAIKNQYNGLTEEDFATQFKALIDILSNTSKETGSSQVQFKYTSKVTPVVTEDGVEEVIKTTPTDYMIFMASDSDKGFEKISVECPKNFRKMLGASLSHSALRELGYKVNKSVYQSNRRGHRMFDVLDINWSTGK